MKGILVTGGAGMIGSNLVKRLIADGARSVRVADNLWRGKQEYLCDETGKPGPSIREQLRPCSGRLSTSGRQFLGQHPRQVDQALYG